MKDTALIVAGAIFLVVAFMHLVKVIFKIEVKIANFIVPLWLSGIGVVIALLLSLWMFRAK